MSKDCMNIRYPFLLVYRILGCSQRQLSFLYDRDGLGYQSKRTYSFLWYSNLIEYQRPTSWFSRAKDQHSTASQQRKQPDLLRNVKRVQPNSFFNKFYSNQEHFFDMCRYLLSTAKWRHATSL